MTEQRQAGVTEQPVTEPESPWAVRQHTITVGGTAYVFTSRIVKIDGPAPYRIEITATGLGPFAVDRLPTARETLREHYTPTART